MSETWLRLGVFVAVFSVMAALEVLAPRRSLRAGKTQRWITNLSIIAINSLMVRALASFAIPIAAVAAAVYAEQNGWGLLRSIDWPLWLEVLVTLAVLDFSLWLQHWASHKFPLLWRVHRMHHADRDIDVTTAIRFHPIEIALSMLWKVLWVLALGSPAAAVLAFEVILNASAMFNHANVRLPLGLDRMIRLLIVTPDMHRVHHSVNSREHHANFGFNLSIWDKLFATYVAEPAEGHDKMTIGLKEFQSASPSELGWSLQLPFKPPSDGN